MRTILAYLQLFRPDAALISFATYLVGSELAGCIEPIDVLAAVLITGLSTNFCYSFNSWADWKVDQVNKPSRPIPSGRISPKGALAYSIALFVLSIIYPFFIARTFLTLFLFLLLPILGVFYSAKPFSLKLRPPISVANVSLGLVIPIVAAYYMKAEEWSPQMNAFFLVLFIFCLSMIPLKDIEDERGDGDWNLYSKYGRRLFNFALAGLGVDFVLVLIMDVPKLLQAGIAIMFSAVALCILWHRQRPDQMGRLYRRIIHVVEASGAVFFAWQVLFNRGVVSIGLF